MRLLIDVGNSRLKWALTDSRQGGAADLRCTGAEPWTGASLARVLGSIPVAAPLSDICIASVAGKDVARALDENCRRLFGRCPRLVSARAAQCGVRNGYAEPERLGADRWAALVGAWSSYRGAVTVIDCGTAVTVDALSATGEFIGGAISPGLSLLRAALASGTHALAPPQIARADIPALETDAAVAGGTLAFLVGGIDHIVAAYRNLLGPAMRCVLTGGDSGQVAARLRGPPDCDPLLVLRGLSVIAEDEPCES